MSPSSRPSCVAIDCGRSGCERPENPISRFCGPRSIQCPCGGSLIVAFSRPGRASSAVTLSMLFVDPPFLFLLAGRESGERPGGDIISDDRARCNPSIVSNLDRSTERIVDAGPDVAPDPRLPLGLAFLVREVGGDVAGSDVR